jgi:hypothetical protein
MEQILTELQLLHQSGAEQQPSRHEDGEGAEEQKRGVPEGEEEKVTVAETAPCAPQEPIQEEKDIEYTGERLVYLPEARGNKKRSSVQADGASSSPDNTAPKAAGVEVDEFGYEVRLVHTQESAAAAEAAKPKQNQDISSDTAVEFIERLRKLSKKDLAKKSIKDLTAGLAYFGKPYTAPREVAAGALFDLLAAAPPVEN